MPRVSPLVSGLTFIKLLKRGKDVNDYLKIVLGIQRLRERELP
ncbi:hypothetical protein [Pelotomaculum isophthalicicum]|nr:hypothetical protein [Pelotomaculum isophthalicicum]